jgi:pathogenesis-related protein 1
MEALVKMRQLGDKICDYLVMTKSVPFCAVWFFAIANVAFSSACSDDSSSSPDEPAALAGITAAHNRVRAEVGVGPMTWSSALAVLATGFIADCQFAHSSSAERSNVAGFDYVGENLYQSSVFFPSGAQVSDAWASEKSSYNYAANACNGVCGHYTQQVWRASTTLGCALKACPGGVNIVSCEYGPGGNYQGQKPY